MLVISGLSGGTLYTFTVRVGTGGGGGGGVIAIQLKQAHWRMVCEYV